MWRIWAKALGEKSGKSDREADIIAGNIRHWNDAHMEKSLREPLEFVNLC